MSLEAIIEAIIFMLEFLEANAFFGGDKAETQILSINLTNS